MICKKYLKKNRLACLFLTASLSLSACAPDIYRQSDADSPAANMVLLAETLRAKGDTQGAMDLYMRALQKDPKDSVALIGLGDMLEKANNNVGAAERYRAALDLTPNDPDLLRRYGRVSLALSHAAEAKSVYAKAYALDSDDAKALNGLAIAEDRLGNHDEALVHFKKAVDLDSSNAGIVNNLAYAHIQDQDYDEAIKLLSFAEHDTKAPATVRQNLALALALSGKTDEAKRVLAIDLPQSKIKLQLSTFQRKQTELAAEKFAAELGSLSTQALAEAERYDLKKIDGLENKAIEIVPDITSGTPIFILKLTGQPKELRQVCALLKEEDKPCRVIRPR